MTGRLSFEKSHPEQTILLIGPGWARSSISGEPGKTCDNEILSGGRHDAGRLGLHHVTAIASDPQATSTSIPASGPRLVKRTVNFDAPDTYHFYYGEVQEARQPLTFFPFADAAAGRAGTGMAETTAFAVPATAFDTWISRLAGEGCDFDGPATRFGITLGLRDPDGLRIELVGEPGLEGAAPARRAGPGHGRDAIRCLHSVALCVEAPERTARLLTDDIRL